MADQILFDIANLFQIMENGNVTIKGVLTVDGISVFNGDTTINNMLTTAVITNNIVSNEIASDSIYPNSSNSYNLGSDILKWNNIYSKFVNISNDLSIGGNVTIAGVPLSNFLSTEQIRAQLVETDLQTQISILTKIIGISTNTLTFTNCNLSDIELNRIFTSLATTGNKRTIIITSNPGTNTCDKSIATSKGWTVTV